MSDASRTPPPGTPPTDRPRATVQFGGIVLAGGRSTRMGRPKAWLPVGDRTMLETVVAAIAAGLGAQG